jgi:hypothetical protein
MFFGQMPRQNQHEDLITLNFYKKNILPGSSKKLYLLQIVSTWCMSCEYKNAKVLNAVHNKQTFTMKIYTSAVYIAYCTSKLCYPIVVCIDFTLEPEFVFAIGATVEKTWVYTARDLKNHGVGTGTVNKDIDPELARLLGVRRLPDFVAVINGRLYHYNGAITMENLKSFVSGLFSTYHLVPEVCSTIFTQARSLYFVMLKIHFYIY